MTPKITEILGQDEITRIVNKVGDNHRKKAFAHYTASDISQQAKLICLEKLKDFDHTKIKTTNLKQALENTVVSNRLKNLFRDNVGVHYKKYKKEATDGPKQKRINLLNPIDISSTYDHELVFISDFTTGDLFKYLLRNLNEEDIDILECLLSGDKVDASTKNKLMVKVISILENNK